MRRALVVFLSASLVAVVGCGKKSYESRLEHTIESMRYKKRLNDNLMAAADDKKFKDLAIYVRAPKDEALAKTGGLPVSEGQFELDASFNDKVDATLHVLARVKLPKKAPAKGAPATPAAPPPQRGAFDSDVVGVLSSVFGSPEGLTTAKPSDEVKKGNRFKRWIFTANEKEVKLYIYKEGNHEVALVFVYDPKLKGPLATKIDLCLESFATGARANHLFQGGAPDEEPEAGPAGPM